MKILSGMHSHYVLKKHLNKNAEEFFCLALASDLSLIELKVLFRGTVDHCTVHCRDIFRFAILSNASQIVVAHNHPYGSLHPSASDQLITTRLMQVSKILEIPLIDHIIFNQNYYYSFAEHNSLKNKS